MAELIPPSISKHHVAEAVADMQRFILSHDAMEGIDTKALIEDGRD